MAFREALLTEAVELLLAGDIEVGKAVLRDYINATVGFEKLAKATGTPSKSLMRMLGPNGNPRASNLLAMLGKLQRMCQRMRGLERADDALIRREGFERVQRLGVGGADIFGAPAVL